MNDIRRNEATRARGDGRERQRRRVVNAALYSRRASPSSTDAVCRDDDEMDARMECMDDGRRHAIFIVAC